MARATTPTRSKKTATKARSTGRSTATRRAAPTRTAAVKKTRAATKATVKAPAKSPAKTTRTTARRTSAAKPSKATTARKAPVKAAASSAKGLHADLEKLETANKTLRAKQREAMKALKFAEGRIAELETQVAELEMRATSAGKPKRRAPKRKSAEIKPEAPLSPETREESARFDDETELADDPQDADHDEF